MPGASVALHKWFEWLCLFGVQLLCIALLSKVQCILFLRKYYMSCSPLNEHFLPSDLFIPTIWNIQSDPLKLWCHHCMYTSSQYGVLHHTGNTGSMQELLVLLTHKCSVNKAPKYFYHKYVKFWYHCIRIVGTVSQVILTSLFHKNGSVSLS